VLRTPVRPARLVLLFATRLLSVLLGFVLFQLCKAFVRPISNLRAGDFLFQWLGNYALLDPAMQGGAVNSQQSSGFRNRVLSHLNVRHHVAYCQEKRIPEERLLRLPGEDKYRIGRGRFEI
jgi:hypothetical protein